MIRKCICVHAVFFRFLPVLALFAIAGCGGDEPADDSSGNETAKTTPAKTKTVPEPVKQPEPPPAVVQSELTPEQIVDQLKDATVYIKTIVAGRVLSTGTGYVIQRDALGNVWIATNRHVAKLDLEGLPAELVPPNSKAQLEVVFRSGVPNKEQALKAELIAVDPSEDIENDIAFLSVRGVANPPLPVEFSKDLEPKEGQAYIGGGFPLGGSVTKIIKANNNPSITITKGSISAIRRDDHFKTVKIIQVDGSLQGGNSGGPIVDAKTGHLIGMAVAKSSTADTIGFLVPTLRIKQALNGTVGQLRYVVNQCSDNSSNMTIIADLFDPKQKMRDIVVYVSQPQAVNGFGPKPDGTWGALPGSDPANMQLNSAKREAQATVSNQHGGPTAGQRTLVIQTAHKDDSGNMVYHPPQLMAVPNKPGPILPPNSMEKLVEKWFAKSMSRLSPLIDPDQDCHLNKEEDERLLKISVPPKVHAIAPELLKSKSPLNNAPMSLAEVSGDFFSLVQVSGDMNPGTEPAPLPTGVTFRHFSGKVMRKLPGTFQGAGLLLFQDDKNYMRVERACFTQDGQPVLQQKILIEIVKNGKHLLEPIYLPVPEADMMIGIARRKGRVSCLILVENAISVGSKELLVDYDDKVKIGICASNISKKPLEAQFKDFIVIDDKAKIDATLGMLDNHEKSPNDNRRN